MKKKLRNLGAAEEEIMYIIWQSETPVTSLYIKERLSNRSTWATSTLQTVLNRLEKKGYVYCDRDSKMNLYSSQVSVDEVRKTEFNALLRNLFNNSMPDMVSNLYSSKTITDKDLEELKEIIAELESKEYDD